MMNINLEYDFLIDATMDKSDLWQFYDGLIGLDIVLSPIPDTTPKPLRLRARVEFLDDFINQVIDLSPNGETTKLSIQSEVNNFIDYLKNLPEYITSYPPYFTFTVQLYAADDSLLIDSKRLIANPWYDPKDDDSLKYSRTGDFNFCANQLTEVTAIVEMVEQAGKLVYGEKTSISFNDYGPQMSVDLYRGGNAPIVVFSDDFIWIKQYSEYPKDDKATIKKDRLRYPGYFIFQEDYDYLCRIITHSECSVALFKETFEQLNTIQA